MDKIVEEYIKTNGKEGVTDILKHLLNCLKNIKIFLRVKLGLVFIIIIMISFFTSSNKDVIVEKNYIFILFILIGIVFYYGISLLNKLSDIHYKEMLFTSYIFDVELNDRKQALKGILFSIANSLTNDKRIGIISVMEIILNKKRHNLNTLFK